MMNEYKRRLECGLVLGIVMLMVVSSLGFVAGPAKAAIVPAWTAATAMGDSRTQAAVVSDENGLVYVMGGVQSIVGGSYANPVPLASSYNSDTGVWTNLRPMDTGVRGPAGVLGQDGRIYVIGGINSTFVDLVQIYDPVANTWSLGAPLPAALWEAKAVAMQEDTIVVAGGSPATSSVYRYSISADVWTVGASMPAARAAGAFINNGYYSIYFGGVDSTYAAVSTTYIYYSWDSWDILPDMPEALGGLAGVRGADGLFYVFGGGAYITNVEAGSVSGYCFDIYSDTWQSLPDLPLALKYLGASATPDGRILALGGNDETAVVAQVQSLRVMSTTVSLSQTTVGAGSTISVTVAMDFAFAVQTGHQVAAYLLSAGQVVYSETNVNSYLPYAFAIDLEVPSTVPAGAYDIVLHNLVANYDSGGSSNPRDLSYAVTVQDVYTVDQQIAMLEANVSAVQMLMIQAMAEANASTMAYLQVQLTTLQAVLTQLGAGLTTMGAGQAAAMASLNVTLADLQLQLDAFQTQIDRVENKADTAGTYGMVTLVLVLVVLVLLALMFMMSRRKT